MHMDWLNPDKKLKRFHFALVVVDVYSTFLYLYPVRRKDAENMVVVLEKFFKETKKTKEARYLWTDLGGEFFNKKNEAVFKKWNIQHYYTKSMQKAYLAERKIRQIKTFLNEVNRSGLLQKLIQKQDGSEYNKDDWTWVTNYIQRKINNKTHSRTGYTPVEMNASENDNVKLLIRHFFIRERLQRKRQLIKRKTEKVDPF